MERNPRYDVFDVPTDSIWIRPGFNCRQAFTMQSVKSLADNIAETGLEIPVILQRREDMQVPCDLDFGLVAGHRRLMAVVTFLHWPTIPANVRIGLTDREAEILNLTENLEREDLNPLEEALAMRRRFPDSASLRAISKEMNKDTRWVHQRLRLLQLPEELQVKVAAGLLSLLDVEMLVKVPPEKQQQAADELIAARGGNKRKLRVNPQFRRAFRQRRGKTEINGRISQLIQAGLEGLATRFGCWCAGYISDEEFDADIRLAQLKKL